MMTVCPQASPSFLPIARATMSLEPPAANGTTRVMVFEGYCACAPVTEPSRTTAAARITAATQGKHFFIGISPAGLFCRLRAFCLFADYLRLDGGFDQPSMPEA